MHRIHIGDEAIDLITKVSYLVSKPLFDLIRSSEYTIMPIAPTFGTKDFFRLLKNLVFNKSDGDRVYFFPADYDNSIFSNESVIIEMQDVGNYDEYRSLLYKVRRHEDIEYYYKANNLLVFFKEKHTTFFIEDFDSNFNYFLFKEQEEEYKDILDFIIENKLYAEKEYFLNVANIPNDIGSRVKFIQ